MNNIFDRTCCDFFLGSPSAQKQSPSGPKRIYSSSERDRILEKENMPWNKEYTISPQMLQRIKADRSSPLTPHRQSSGSQVPCGIGIVWRVEADPSTGCDILVVDAQEQLSHNEAVQEGDILAKINGEDVYGMAISDIAERMFGPPGTRISLTLFRGSLNGKLIVADLQRQSLVHNTPSPRSPRRSQLPIMAFPDGQHSALASLTPTSAESRDKYYLFMA